MFIHDLRTGFQLRLRVYPETLKQFDRLRRHQGWDCLHHGPVMGESSALRLFDPLLWITVAVKYNPLMLSGVLFDHVMDGHVKVVCFFQDVTGFFERLRNDRIEDDIRWSDGIPGTDHTEFKFISCKGKRWRPIPVCGILCQVRECLDTRLQFAAL